MITENIKKGTGLGHDAALRVDLAERKAKYEESGHKFNHDEVFGWEARTDEQFFGTFERLEQLLDHLDGLKAEAAVEPVESEPAAPADAKSIEDRAVEILVREYFSEREIADVAGLPVNDAKKALTKAATQDHRGSSGPDYHFSTSKGTIGFWFGNKMRPEADVEIKVARIASLVVEKQREAAPADDDLTRMEKIAKDSLEALGWKFEKNSADLWAALSPDGFLEMFPTLREAVRWAKNKEADLQEEKPVDKSAADVCLALGVEHLTAFKSAEKWAKEEAVELQKKGWNFVPVDDGLTFSFEGITFGPHPDLERCVQGARSLDSLRAAGNMEELKQIAFERAVERLCVLQFKMHRADDALTMTDAQSGSGALIELQKKVNEAAAAYQKALEATSSDVWTKADGLLLELYQRISFGWEIDLDSTGWSAARKSETGDSYEDGVSGVNSLERLIGFCDRMDEEAAEAAAETSPIKLEIKEEPVRAEEEAETGADEDAAPEAEEAAPAGQMTLDEIEEVEDFLTNGWAIRKKESGAYWAHKVINGKPVTIEERVLDDLIVRMEEFDPPKDVRPAETLPTSEIKKVRFQLTDEDVKMKTDSLLEVMTVIDTKKTALADIKKDYKKALDKLQEEQDELADQIRSRVEYRPIECLIEYDLNRGEKIYYRPDTQEQIDRVSMSKDELRIALANQNQANLKHGQKDLF
ncbi:MAG: hypothetical protein JSS81_07215 [Acidobacteria bacterium]|nr:hypothetical protein [Acidobacteriota bacterium]